MWRIDKILPNGVAPFSYSFGVYTISTFTQNPPRKYTYVAGSAAGSPVVTAKFSSTSKKKKKYNKAFLLLCNEPNFA